MKHIKLFENHHDIFSVEYLTDGYTKVNPDKLKEALDKVENGYHYLDELEYYLENPNQNHKPQRAAKELEEETQLENISGNWNFPYGGDYALNEIMVGIVYSDSTDEDFKKLFMEYYKLNPEMANYNISSFRDAYEILLGMTSGYSFDDINSFLTRKGMQIKPDERDRSDKIERTIGRRFSYVPSVKTIEKIEKQLGL